MRFSFLVHFLMLNCSLRCTGPVFLNYLALHVKNGGLLSYYVTLHKYRNENSHSLREKMENILNLLQWEKEMWETPDSPWLVDNSWNWTRMKTWLEASLLQTEKHKLLLKLPVEPRIENTQRDDSGETRCHSLTLPIWFSIMQSPCLCSQSIICLLRCLALVPSTSSLSQHYILWFSISPYSLSLAIWPLICLCEHLKWLLAAMEPHMIDASSSVPVSKTEPR